MSPAERNPARLRRLLPLDLLLDDLVRAGFAQPGVTLRLRLAALLDKFSEEKTHTLTDLKYRLAALCCHNKEEQELFYGLFEAFVERCKLEEEIAALPPKPDGPPPSPPLPQGSTEEKKPAVLPATTAPPPASRPVGKRVGPLVLELHFDDDGYRPWNLPELEPTLRPLREKEWTMAEDWDVPASIRRSIRAGGAPLFVRRQRRRAPQYLFLIEQKSHRDHLAALYAELVGELRRRDLDAEYYYFDYQLQRCWKDRRDPATHTDLGTLSNIYPGARLVIIGEPELLLERPLLRPSALAYSLRDDWGAVALLNTRSVAAWAHAEEALCRVFPVAPASIEGLGSLLEQWTKRISLTPFHWKSLVAEPLTPKLSGSQPGVLKVSDADLERTLRGLQTYLGRQGFNWLCAAAVYPEIYWPLTKMLHDEGISAADVPDETQRRQVWLLVLLRLSRLDWFRQGSIPSAYRRVLREKLAPVSKIAVRQELLRVLELDENKQVTKGSYAAKDRAYTIAMLQHEEALARPELDEKERANIEAAFRERVAQEEVDLSDIADAVGREVLQGVMAPAVSETPVFRVLWVDNQPKNNAESIALLQKQGIEIQTAFRTEEAFALLSQQDFSLILSDLGRESDPVAGLDMLRQMRARGLSTPIGICAKRAEEFRSQLREAGANAITDKNEEIEKWVLDNFTTWQAAQTGTDAEVPATSGGLQVLWVDDEPKNNERFQDELNELMHAVFTNARSTEEALSLLDRKPFDIVISDISRGRVNSAGVEMLRAFRERGIDFGRLPVIFYTTPAMVMRYEGELKELGAAGVFNSKVEVRKFLKTLIDVNRTKRSYDIRSQQNLTNKYLLLEYFSNSHDSISKSRNPAFRQLISQTKYVSIIHQITYHAPIPYNDCVFYLDNKVDNSNRVEEYKIDGVPRLAINGSLQRIGNPLLPEKALQAYLNQNSPINIQVVEEMKKASSQLLITAYVHTLGNIPDSEYRIYVALVEKTVRRQTQNGETVHYNVFRKMLPNSNGLEYTPSKMGIILTFTFSCIVASSWNPEEIYAIVFIQDIYSKEILNSGTKFDLSDWEKIQVPSPNTVQQKSSTEKHLKSGNPQIAESLFTLKRKKIDLERKQQKLLEQQQKIIEQIKNLNSPIELLDNEIKKSSTTNKKSPTKKYIGPANPQIVESLFTLKRKKIDLERKQQKLLEQQKKIIEQTKSLNISIELLENEIKKSS